MIALYADMIERGTKTIDGVPNMIREKVQKELDRRGYYF